jgi:hypothetical protein
MSDSGRWWSDEDIFEEIRRLEEKLGKPPTLQDFNEHAEMSEGVIWSHFDSWNDAKEQAGVEAYSHYPSGEKGNPNLTKAGLYRKVKNGSSCKFCEEDFNACLVFHHLPDEEKSFEVSQFKKIAPSVKELQEEIDKCIVLCSNCHRKVHSNDHELSL